MATIAIMSKHSKLQALCAKIVELYPSQAWGWLGLVKLKNSLDLWKPMDVHHPMEWYVGNLTNHQNKGLPLNVTKLADWALWPRSTHRQSPQLSGTGLCQAYSRSQGEGGQYQKGKESWSISLEDTGVAWFPHQKEAEEFNVVYFKMWLGLLHMRTSKSQCWSSLSAWKFSVLGYPPFLDKHMSGISTIGTPKQPVIINYIVIFGFLMLWPHVLLDSKRGV